MIDKESGMNIIVCVKQVPDPEAPPASFKVDESANKMTTTAGVAQVVSPFDEQAVEAALRIKDAGGAKITVLSMGNNLTRDVIKKPLAMGSDELILLEDEAFEGGDSWTTAHCLAEAIKKIGEYDLIICGRQAADWDAGQVGLGIAELLGIPAISLAQKVEVVDSKVKVERVATDGYEVIEAPLPCLITVSNELGEPRYPALRGIMAAAKKQPTIWKPQDIGLDPASVGAQGRRTKLLKLFQPVREGKCEIIEGESPEETAVNLALKLREAKLV
jgi:electron transfer flavoprotein beta subunit